MVHPAALVLVHRVGVAGAEAQSLCLVVLGCGRRMKGSMVEGVLTLACVLQQRC